MNECKRKSIDRSLYTLASLVKCHSSVCLGTKEEIVKEVKEDFNHLNLNLYYYTTNINTSTTTTKNSKRGF